jgi:hypothetical protein
MQDLNIDDDFMECYGRYITIPEKTVFWRGYDKNYDSVSDRPAYYGSRSIATEYANKNNRTLGSFTNKNPLKLLDIRFMRILLKDLFQNLIIPDNKSYIKKNIVFNGKNNKNAEEIKAKIIISTTVSFGLCSLKHQIDLLTKIFEDTDELNALKNIYKEDSLIEQDGVRVGETVIDAFTMSFLKDLFENFADGFISPRLKTPYHIEKNGQMNPEMIIFNPDKSGIMQIRPMKNLPTINLSQIITDNGPLITKTNYVKYKTRMFYGGGAYKELHPLDTLDDLLNKGDQKTIELYNDASTIGKKWREKYLGDLLFLEPPVTIKKTVFKNNIFENSVFDPKLIFEDI